MEISDVIIRVNAYLHDYFGDRYKASTTDKAVLINGTTIHTQEDGLIPQDVVQAVQGWVNAEIMKLSGLNGHLSVLSAQVSALSCVCRINPNNPLRHK